MARRRCDHRLGGQFSHGDAKPLLLNIVVGIVGAFLAGLLLTPYLGISTINQNDFSLPALMVSLLGAIILLTVLSFFSRRTRETTEDFGEEVTQSTAETQAASAPSVQPQPAVGNFCRQCGTANPADAQFCKNCGANLGPRSDLATA
ncbi:MAG TPA: GlsB/YeaQ/YmgE family stress response membrane protein [Anaerolineae bacterium]|jgi:uncharacterized membrane protein YeaQ/YmgE (transglycosylase-associated protein family)/ribosomal protein L40E